MKVLAIFLTLFVALTTCAQKQDPGQVKLEKMRQLEAKATNGIIVLTVNQYR